MSTLQDMNFDFVAFHSEKDGLTDPDGSKALYSKSCAKHKTLTLLDSMWHYLTHEEGKSPRRLAKCHPAAHVRSTVQGCMCLTECPAPQAT